MTTLNNQETLETRRPCGCPDKIWNKFIRFFPVLYKTEEDLPELIYWCNILKEECLEISYISIYIDSDMIEMCDNKTGKWYSESEIISFYGKKNS
jgi:hypothetical protein